MKTRIVFTTFRKILVSFCISLVVSYGTFGYSQPAEASVVNLCKLYLSKIFRVQKNANDQIVVENKQAVTVENEASYKFTFPVEPPESTVYQGKPNSPRNPIEEEKFSLLNTRITNRTLPAYYGGELRIIEESVSGFSPTSTRNYLRGYATMNHDLFGQEAAEFLGHKKIAEKEYTDPDADALNASLEYLNSQAASDLERTFISFYEPVGEDRVGDKSYIIEFGFFGHHPKSRNGDERVHDAGFHEGAIILPKDYVRLARAQARTRIRFLWFLRANDLIKDYFIGVTSEAQYLDEAAIDIDSFTGNPSARMIPHVSRNTGRGDDTNVGIEIYNALQAGRSPRNMLLQRLTHRPTISPRLQKGIEEFVKLLEKIEPDFDLELFPIRHHSPMSPEARAERSAYFEKIRQELEQRRTILSEKMAEHRRAQRP